MVLRTEVSVARWVGVATQKWNVEN